MLDSRDAVAKTVYGRLFSWIVNKINTLLAPEDMGNSDKTSDIGTKAYDYPLSHFHIEMFPSTFYMVVFNPHSMFDLAVQKA